MLLHCSGGLSEKFNPIVLHNGSEFMIFINICPKPEKNVLPRLALTRSPCYWTLFTNKIRFSAGSSQKLTFTNDIYKNTGKHIQRRIKI